MWPCDCGRIQRWLETNYISPRNLPRSSTCPFSKTMVLIVACLQLFKVHAPSILAMWWDRQYHDLEGAPESDGSNMSFQVLRIISNLPKSTVVIYCLFLPSFLHPRAILSLNDQVTCGPPNQWTRLILSFELRESRFSNFACSRSISLRVHDPTRHVPFGSTITILSGIWGLKFSSLN